MPQIKLNGEARHVPDGATLASLVAPLDKLPQVLATAVNGEFVPRQARAQLLLLEGDEILTFQPVTGG